MPINTYYRAATTLVFILFVSPHASHSAPQVNPGLQMLRVTLDDASQLDTLVALERQRRDLQIWTDRLALGPIDVRASLAAVQAIEKAGLSFEVTIPDLQAYYGRLFPGGGGDFFDSYRTFEEHVAFMQNLEATYPSLVQMISVGKSVLNRDLWALRITGPGNDKVGVLHYGATHGNEVMGAAVVAYTAQHLLVNYGTDAEITALVNDVEWFLLPIMNPDGYVSGSRYNAAGADLNRDWGGPWTGPGAFSEPETVAMADFFISHPNVRVILDFHTFGRMILWPWGHTPVLSDHNALYDALGDDMAFAISQVRGVDYWQRGPINTTIYPTMGDAADYAYGVLDRWAFGIEIGTSHYMPTSEIVPSGQEMAAALMAVSDWAADCNGNGALDWQELSSGQAEDCNGNLTPDECEMIPDFDGDGIMDICDPDTDNDGVLNEDDICPFSAPGAPIHPTGSPISDSNGNCFVDHVDFARFRLCLLGSGPGTPPLQEQCEQYFDGDGDGDVDLADLAMFFGAFDPGGG